MLKFENIRPSQYIKAYDFQPVVGIAPIFITGMVISHEVVTGVGYLRTRCMTDSMTSDSRVGKIVMVPMQMGKTDYNERVRVIDLSNKLEKVRKLTSVGESTAARQEAALWLQQMELADIYRSIHTMEKKLARVDDTLKHLRNAADVALMAVAESQLASETFETFMNAL